MQQKIELLTDGFNVRRRLGGRASGWGGGRAGRIEIALASLDFRKGAAERGVFVEARNAGRCRGSRCRSGMAVERREKRIETRVLYRAGRRHARRCQRLDLLLKRAQHLGARIARSAGNGTCGFESFDRLHGTLDKIKNRGIVAVLGEARQRGHRAAPAQTVKAFAEIGDPGLATAGGATGGAGRLIILAVILVVEASGEHLIEPLAHGKAGAMGGLHRLFPDIRIDPPNAPRHCIRHFRPRSRCRACCGESCEGSPNHCSQRAVLPLPASISCYGKFGVNRWVKIDRLWHNQAGIADRKVFCNLELIMMRPVARQREPEHPFNLRNGRARSACESLLLLQAVLENPRPP
ncbi:MAG TPA: hypothetical protein PLE50_00645 [Rhabdaerophilum sp.]|nr:hypothetical protein [Rhabdaerophilum sp.]